MHCSIPVIPVHQIQELAQTDIHWVSNEIQPSHPLSSSPHLLLPSICPSIRVLSSESVLYIRWPKHWSYSFSNSLENFQWILRTDSLSDWLVWYFCSPCDSQEFSKTSSFAAFFMVQPSHPYLTTGKTIALIRWTFVSKVMSLLLNMLSRLVIAFLPRSKHLLISWLAVTIVSDFGAQENKVCHYFHYFPIYLPWSDGTGCHDLSFLNVDF